MRSIGLLRLLLIIFLITAISGCIGCGLSDIGSFTGSNRDSNTGNDTNAGNGVELTVITSAVEIDAALANGPVMAKFGADWCGPCRLQEPILKELSTAYPKVSFLEVDTDDSPALAKEFFVNGIPHMVIIVEKDSDGKYVFVDQFGKTTTDRAKAAIVGTHYYASLKPLVEKAISERVK